MPNVRVHRQITRWIATGALIAAPVVSWSDMLAIEAGILVTLLPELTPDLDINHRRFGVLGEFLGLRTYAKLVPHRFGLRQKHWSRLKIWHIFMFSHIPLLGTLPRFLMLCLPVGMVMLVFSYHPSWLLRFLILMWFGMSLSDTGHVIADVLTRDFKEFNRKFWGNRKFWARIRNHGKRSKSAAYAITRYKK